MTILHGIFFLTVNKTAERALVLSQAALEKAAAAPTWPVLISIFAIILGIVGGVLALLYKKLEIQGELVAALTRSDQMQTDTIQRLKREIEDGTGYYHSALTEIRRDKEGLARDVKDRLDEQDEKIERGLRDLKESVSQEMQTMGSKIDGIAGQLDGMTRILQAK